jgi:hypothetical protein
MSTLARQIDGNPLLAHEWGASEAVDHIWAEICGRPPSTEPWRRWFVVVQCYLDDSYTQGGAHVLAGYVARAESWAKFTKEWEQLLPRCYRGGNSGRHRFKMSEMARRMEDVPLFLDVIRSNVSYAVSIMMKEDELERAKGR